MTNVFSTAEKVARKRTLFRLGEEALEREGWTLTRVPGAGKASLRQVTRGSVTKLASIKTTQDTWFAFSKAPGGKDWVTLDDVDIVAVASVDDYHNPTKGLAHIIPGDVARDRFNRAYAARDDAGHVQPEGRGIWIALYEKEEPNGPVAYIGGGLGLDYPPVLKIDLAKGAAVSTRPESPAAPVSTAEDSSRSAEGPLTIPDAKRRLALSLGVPEDAIKITVEH